MPFGPVGVGRLMEELALRIVSLLFCLSWFLEWFHSLPEDQSVLFINRLLITGGLTVTGSAHCSGLSTF